MNAVVDIRTRREPRTIDGVPPPHDLDAEAAVLSTILLDGGDVLSVIADVVTAEDFYSEAHRRIFESAEKLWRAGTPVDIVTIATALRDAERLDQVGGVQYLRETLGFGHTLRATETYARTIADKARLRRVIAECQRVANEGYGGVDDVQRFCDEAETRIGAMARGRSSNVVERNRDAFKRIVAEIQAAHARGASITGTRSGFDRVDRLTNGIHRGQLSIVAARPGIGKTAYAAQVAAYVAALGVGVLFFSVEMSRDEILKRLTCSHADVMMPKLQRGELSQTDWNRMTGAMQHIAALPLMIDDTNGATALHVRSGVMRAIANRKPNEPEIGLVVVDYLQKLAPSSSNTERRLQVAESSEILRRIAKDFVVPVVATAQLNRENEKPGRTSKSRRPGLADLRECGDIEQDAYVVQFIHRERTYDAQNEYDDRSVDVEVVLAKNRNGPETVVKLGWRGVYTRFENLEEGYA